MTDSHIADSELIKQREILFSPLFHPDTDQTEQAAQLLTDISLIRQARRTGDYAIQVTYSIADITLKIIEETLMELGFHLETALLVKLKRALYYYMEETQCINLGFKHLSKDTSQLFINEFQRHQHGCRDVRPKHLRNYR